MMKDPLIEARRAAGQFALFLAGVYVLGLFGVAVSSISNHPLSFIKYLLTLVPAAFFTPSVVAAVRLHRTRDRDETKRLWRRSFALAIAGLAALVGVSFLAAGVSP